MLLMNRELDLRPNQSSTGGEEDTWIILSRLNHRLLAVRSPDPSDYRRVGRWDCRTDQVATCRHSQQVWPAQCPFLLFPSVNYERGLVRHLKRLPAGCIQLPHCKIGANASINSAGPQLQLRRRLWRLTMARRPRPKIYSCSPKPCSAEAAPRRRAPSCLHRRCEIDALVDDGTNCVITTDN